MAPGRTGPFNCVFYRVTAGYGGDTTSSCALARLKSTRLSELPANSWLLPRSRL